MVRVVAVLVGAIAITVVGHWLDLSLLAVAVMAVLWAFAIVLLEAIFETIDGPKKRRRL